MEKRVRNIPYADVYVLYDSQTMTEKHTERSTSPFSYIDVA